MRRISEFRYLDDDGELQFGAIGRPSPAKLQGTPVSGGEPTSGLYPSIFRNVNSAIPQSQVPRRRYEILRQASESLIERLTADYAELRKALFRNQTLQWAVLQHYEVCDTPLLDLTDSLETALSFASSTAEDGVFCM